MKTIIALLSAALVVGEVLRPLRRRQRESKGRRTARNLAIAGLAAAAVQLAEQPLVAPVARAVERRRLGLVPQLGLQRSVETFVALAALDYTLYLWHILVHRVPWLWRFHAVHHVDRDLDTSTAIRFHFGELLLSIPWRAAQIAGIGVSPRTLTLWQSLTLTSILFHHSNVRLPRRLERALGYIVVTPRMHGIHHSIDPAEVNSNWSSGLTVWDRLHGTLRTDVRPSTIEIGVAGYERAEDVTLSKIIAQPFARLPSAVRAAR